MPTFREDQPLPPPPAERIARLEESFCHKLPDDYLRFVRDHNGARLATPQVRLAGADSVIERFLPIVADPGIDAEGKADIAVVATRLDAHLARSADVPGFDLIPFAALVGGDFLVLDYAAGPEPSVAIWYHATSDEFAPDTKPVAASFAEFMATLP